MIRKALLLLVVAGALAAVPVAALAGNGPPVSQKMVWVCQYPGNTAPAGTPGGVTGDYVVIYKAGGPSSWCTDHGGLRVITISAAAVLNGHGHKGIQFPERIAGYPAG